VTHSSPTGGPPGSDRFSARTPSPGRPTGGPPQVHKQSHGQAERKTKVKRLLRTVWIILLVVAYSLLALWVGVFASSPWGVGFVVVAIVSLLAILAWRWLVVVGFVAIIAALGYLAVTTVLDYNPFHGHSELVLPILGMAGLALWAIALRMMSPKSYGKKPGQH